MFWKEKLRPPAGIHEHSNEEGQWPERLSSTLSTGRGPMVYPGLKWDSKERFQFTTPNNAEALDHQVDVWAKQIAAAHRSMPRVPKGLVIAQAKHKSAPRRFNASYAKAGGDNKHTQKTSPEGFTSPLKGPSVEVQVFLVDEEVLVANESIVRSSAYFVDNEAAASEFIETTRRFACHPRV